MSEHKTIVQAVEDRFFEEEKLSDKTDIAEWTGISTSRVDSVIGDLTGNGLVTVYEKRGSATLYLTRQMFNSLNAQAGEPDWLEKYEFEQKKDLRGEIKEANEYISEFQRIERLLYGGGIPLEESVEFGLKILGFDPESTETDEDFVIVEDDERYVIEVKGVGGKINKSHITQLGGWLDKKLSAGVEPENLTGILLHNHDRHTNPSERGYPLTDEAERFLKFRQSLHIHSKTLFELVKDVKAGEMSQEDARNDFLEGDKYAN